MCVRQFGVPPLLVVHAHERSCVDPSSFRLKIDNILGEVTFRQGGMKLEQTTHRREWTGECPLGNPNRTEAGEEK